MYFPWDGGYCSTEEFTSNLFHTPTLWLIIWCKHNYVDSVECTCTWMSRGNDFITVICTCRHGTGSSESVLKAHLVPPAQRVYVCVGYSVLCIAWNVLQRYSWWVVKLCGACTAHIPILLLFNVLTLQFRLSYSTTCIYSRLSCFYCRLFYTCVILT